MSADSIFAESLVRIEHKLDLTLKLVTILLNNLSGNLTIDQTALGDMNHVCPVCSQFVKYNIDLGAGVVTRSCGCKTGKVVVNLADFAPPQQPRRPDVRTESGAEDGADTGSSRGGVGKSGPPRR